MALICLVPPTGMLESVDVTDMEDRIADLTVRVMFPEILPEMAVMVAVPVATEVATPMLLTFATDVFDDLQMTWVVISRLFPSAYAPVAVNCWVNPTGMLGIPRVTDMEASLVVGPAAPFLPHPHVVRDTAKNPANNIAKTNLIFFMRTPPGKQSPSWVSILPISVCKDLYEMNCKTCLLTTNPKTKKGPSL